MTDTRSLRIAILAHSTNPRGGVVHALAVADSLRRLGHDPVVHAPDLSGRGFFRSTVCKTVSVPATPVGTSMRQLVETRIADYIGYFENHDHRRFDVFHAQDGISGAALATLKERGLISGFARTVHHIDAFSDQRVAELQTRSILSADRHFVVSRLWRETLKAEFDLDATPIGNGVDRQIFSPQPTPRDPELSKRFALDGGPIFLAVGGVEARKNTLNILAAFAQVLALHPSAHLVIAGGVSLLDHRAYQAAFRAEMDRLGEASSRVLLTGAIDQDDMPALYRIADTLVFPSVKEGFGLVAIEAIACGTPVVTSRIPPFTEHFDDDDVIWCDPKSVATIANAMALAVKPRTRALLAARRDAILAPHSWLRVAEAHLPIYHAISEVEHA